MFIIPSFTSLTPLLHFPTALSHSHCPKEPSRIFTASISPQTMIVSTAYSAIKEACTNEHEMSICLMNFCCRPFLHFPSTFHIHIHTRGLFNWLRDFNAQLYGKNPEESKKARVLLTLAHHALVLPLSWRRVGLASCRVIFLQENHDHKRRAKSPLPFRLCNLCCRKKKKKCLRKK